MSVSYYHGSYSQEFTIRVDFSENNILLLREFERVAKEKAQSMILDNEIGTAIDFLELAHDIDKTIREAIEDEEAYKEEALAKEAADVDAD